MNFNKQTHPRGHHPDQDIDHSHGPRKFLLPPSSLSSPPTPSNNVSNFYYQTLDLSVLELHINGIHIVYTPPCLTSFSHHNVFEIHPKHYFNNLASLVKWTDKVYNFFHAPKGFMLHGNYLFHERLK